MCLWNLPLPGFLGMACAIAAPAEPIRTEVETIQVREIAGGLEHPWAVAFLPNGDMLVTERPGRMRLIADGELRDEPVAGMPPIFARRQGGLLDLVLDPEFARNQQIYFAYSHAEGELTTTRVMRARFAPEGLSEQEVIFEAKPLVDSAAHFGSRLAFGQDHTLYITMGERFVEQEEAQNLGTHLGKVLRINRDGTVPDDNPFVNTAGALPEIYTYGHRNPQGLFVDPVDGRIWEQEHGARGGDEINLLRPGANYGWPIVAYGVNYDGSTIGEGVTDKPGVEQPLFYWDPSIAPSGMTRYLGDRFPGWQGDLFVGALKGRLVSRLDLDEQGRIVKEEQFLVDKLGRIRDIRSGPDGLLYLLSDRNPGGLYRLEPAADGG